MPNYDSRVAGIAVRTYFKQCDSPGCCQVADRVWTEYDAARAVVILRSDGGKVLATYRVADLEAIAEWWEEDGDTNE